MQPIIHQKQYGVDHEHLIGTDVQAPTMTSTTPPPYTADHRPFTDTTSAPDYGTNTPAFEEMGSRSSLNRDDVTQDRWEMNYHEAAIYLEEGANNEKFDAHPRHPSALPAYLLVHNQWYHNVDLLVSLLLLALALFEPPAVIHMPLIFHAILEMCALTLIAFELILKLRWIGWRTVLSHRRTMLKLATLCVMCVEVGVLLVRRSSHFRVTRALRPIFLIDTRACGAIRRYIRQILQSLPPIVDMLILLLFFVCSYALLGYFLFGEHKNNLYFDSLSDSFVSMFVLLTTANFPDVMMPSYAVSKWSAIFFISYISTVLYVLMNLMLAVVYETFTGIEKEKFRKLLLHRRRACRYAFRLLVSKQSPTVVRFRQFHGMLRYYAPKASVRDALLIFRRLDGAGIGTLTEDDFVGVYDAMALRWCRKHPITSTPSYGISWLNWLCDGIHRCVTWQHFDTIIYCLIGCNCLAMAIRMTETDGTMQQRAIKFSAGWDSFLFYSIFILEASIKIIAYGWTEYSSSGWNCYDLTVTLAALFGAFMILLVPTLKIVVILRPLRLLRLFKMKKRYRDIFGTLVLLSPLMWSTAIVMLVMYYFFAVIGMELFAGYDLRNCCVNTTVEDFYHYSSNESSSALGYYYLNNFANLLSSGVTLFELTVVNNWFIVMDAYASVSHSSARLFFMLFYLLTMVVLTIVVASVLEAFRFRIQYKRQTSKRDEEQMLHEEVIIDWPTIERLVYDRKLLDVLKNDFNQTSVYIGRRRRTRDVLQKHMYSTEIAQWMNEEDRTCDLGVSNDDVAIRLMDDTERASL